MLEKLLSKVRTILNIIVKPHLLLKLITGSLVYYSDVIMNLVKICQFRTDKTYITIDYHNGVYSDFYIHIYSQLKKIPEIENNIILSYTTKHIAWTFDDRYEKKDYKPRFILRFLKKNIIITATKYVSRYPNEKKAKKIQMYHGFAGFGTGWSADTFVKGFDRLFVPLQYQYYQLTEGEYNSLINKEHVIKVGYPKIDGTIEEAKRRTPESKLNSFFYGPTWTIKSSIFSYLMPLVKYTHERNIKLYIKLHPMILKEFDYYSSGKINWTKKIQELKEQYNNIVLLDTNLSFESVRKHFFESDVFITDTSGLGWEYILITGRPIIFLGEKLKIPKKEFDEEALKKISESYEIKYRGIVGPVIKEPECFEEELNNFFCKYNGYLNSIDQFRKNFTYNLGSAAPVAVREILNLYSEINSNYSLDKFIDKNMV
jgi:CDP-glycerol glycerophosphotransferase (TagB/SpsB family)